jgi:hypothetical protein
VGTLRAVVYKHDAPNGALPEADSIGNTEEPKFLRRSSKCHLFVFFFIPPTYARPPRS